VLSDRTKQILVKSKSGLDKITIEEAGIALDEVTTAMNLKNPVEDPDYFTLAFIRGPLLRRANGNQILKKK